MPIVANSSCHSLAKKSQRAQQKSELSEKALLSTTRRMGAVDVDTKSTRSAENINPVKKVVNCTL